MPCTKNGSYCENEKREKKSGGGGGQGGCVQRMEVIVKRKQKSGVTVDVDGEVKIL